MKALLNHGPLRDAALVALVALILLVPAFINGRPFIYFDSEHYFQIGKAIWERLMPAGETTIAAGAGSQAEATGTGGGLAAVAGGRSPVYSLIFYVLSAKASMWLVCALQATLAAWLVTRFLDLAWGGRRELWTLGAAVFLSALTPLSFHVSFTVPDIYAGLFLLSLSLVAFGPKRGALETSALWGIAGVSVLMHATILALAIVAVGVLAAAWAWPILRPQVRPAGIALSAAAAVAGVAFSAAYSFAVARIAGETVASPPYLMARVIADGPGLTLINERCVSDAEPYAVCAFRGRTFASQNDWLWGERSEVSFQASPQALKMALAEEEKRFVLDVLKAYPLQQGLASATAAARLWVDTGISDLGTGAERLATTPGWENSAALQALPTPLSCGKDCKPFTTTHDIWSGIVRIVGLIAMPLLVIAAVRLLGSADPAARRLGACGLFILVMILANGAICGILSGVHDRYQGRVVWLAALAALAFWLRPAERDAAAQPQAVA